MNTNKFVYCKSCEYSGAGPLSTQCTMCRSSLLYVRIPTWYKPKKTIEERSTLMAAIQRHAWDLIKKHVAADKGISEDDAEDIMKEVRWVLADYYEGCRDYTTVGEILETYLGIPEDYEWVFSY